MAVNAPSTPAAVPIALGDGSKGSKLVVVDELGRVVGVVVIVVEGVRADVKRPRLLRLFHLADDLLPHRFRDNRTHRLIDLAQLTFNSDFVPAVVPGIDQRLQPTRRDDAGVHIDPGVRVDQGLIALTMTVSKNAMGVIAVATPSMKSTLFAVARRSRISR